MYGPVAVPACFEFYSNSIYFDRHADFLQEMHLFRLKLSAQLSAAPHIQYEMIAGKMEGNEKCHTSHDKCIKKISHNPILIVKTTTQPQLNPKTTPKQPNTTQLKLGLT